MKFDEIVYVCVNLQELLDFLGHGFLTINGPGKDVQLEFLVGLPPLFLVRNPEFDSLPEDPSSYKRILKNVTPTPGIHTR